MAVGFSAFPLTVIAIAVRPDDTRLSVQHAHLPLAVERIAFWRHELARAVEQTAELVALVLCAVRPCRNQAAWFQQAVRERAVDGLDHPTLAEEGKRARAVNHGTPVQSFQPDTREFEGCALRSD